jgi:hypothetical protein
MHVGRHEIPSPASENPGLRNNATSAYQEEFQTEHNQSIHLVFISCSDIMQELDRGTIQSAG